jgi:protocatechuate 3,4-dioxygenase beta subunit
LLKGRDCRPRDQQRPAAQAGTAVIRGRVFAGDTGKPLRRARISVSGQELAGNPRNTSTDSDGRYEVTDLPAGRYTLRVDRSGYLPLRYGQHRPLEPAKPLQLLDKQIVENVDFSLPKMGLITGRIADEFGDPIEGVNVYALRSMYFNGRRQLVPTGGGARTDDAGQYRLLSLAPGTYFVTASTRETWTVNRGGVKEVMGYAPTYFPGTARASDARRVTVKPGQEAGNIDLSLIPGRAARISGTAFDSHGKPYSNVGVRQEVRGDDFASFSTVASGNVAPDGTFSIPTSRRVTTCLGLRPGATAASRTSPCCRSPSTAWTWTTSRLPDPREAASPARCSPMMEPCLISRVFA